MSDIQRLRQDIYAARDTEDNKTIRPLLIMAARELPKTPESLELFCLGFELLDRIQDPTSRALALLEYSKEIPSTTVFIPLYLKAAEAAIIAADSLDESYRRIVELTRIAEDMPKSPEFNDLRVLAWRLALDLPDRPRFAPPPIEKIAGELPKSSDLSFFTRYTLLGIARMAPKDGPFAKVYREAIELAMSAAAVIDEPFYRRYASFGISAELPKSPEFADLYLKALRDAFKYSLEMKDPFAREFGLIELLQRIPKTREFFLLLQQVLEQSLSFFTVRKWMEDVEVFDVVDANQDDRQVSRDPVRPQSRRSARASTQHLG